jgi:hypothetical protein
VDIAGIGIFAFVVGLTIVLLPMGIIAFGALLWAVIRIMREQRKIRKSDGQA